MTLTEVGQEINYVKSELSTAETRMEEGHHRFPKFLMMYAGIYFRKNHPKEYKKMLADKGKSG